MLGYNNNYENRDGMYQYGFQGGELNQAPAPKNKRQHNGRAVRAAKRIGAITLSLFVLYRSYKRATPWLITKRATLPGWFFLFSKMISLR